MRRLIVAVVAAALFATCSMISVAAAASAAGSHGHPPTTTTTTSSTTTTTTPDGYIFDEEFNGTAVDLSKWQPNWLGDTNSQITAPVSAENNCYDPAQVSEPGDGYLHLSAAARACTVQVGRKKKVYPYASGLVNTHATFTFTTGHLEARVFLPAASAGVIANWPAVWTDGLGTWPTTGESDIMEGLSGQACFTYHGPLRSNSSGACVPGDFTGWHTYAETVTATTTDYFYDGVNVGSEPNVHAPHYLILNYAVGGVGGPVVTPAEMLVDYIHVTP